MCFIMEIRPECSFSYARLGVVDLSLQVADIARDFVSKRIKTVERPPQVLAPLRATRKSFRAADPVQTIHERHPDVAARVVAGLMYLCVAPN